MHKIFVSQKVYFMPLHVSSTCDHHQEVKIALHSLWYHHTYRWPSRAQKDLVIQAISYGIFVMHLCKQSSRSVDVLNTIGHIHRPARQQGLPDEHKIFEICRIQEGFNSNINLKSAFCCLTLHNLLRKFWLLNMTISVVSLSHPLYSYSMSLVSTAPPPFLLYFFHFRNFLPLSYFILFLLSTP